MAMTLQAKFVTGELFHPNPPYNIEARLNSAIEAIKSKGGFVSDIQFSTPSQNFVVVLITYDMPTNKISPPERA